MNLRNEEILIEIQTNSRLIEQNAQVLSNLKNQNLKKFKK